MKKLIPLFLALFSTSLTMAQGVSNDTVTVYSAKEFIDAIKKNNDVNIKLGDDIQLGVINQRICDTFTGSINGLYTGIDKTTGEETTLEHVIYGDLNNQVKWTNYEMFGTVDGAEFRDLIITNIFVDTNNHNNTGVIASKATNSTFFNVIFDKVNVKCNNDDAGLIAGNAKDSHFGMVTTQYCDVYTAGIHAGGLVGSSDHCDFEFCINNPGTQVFADGRLGDDAYAGGFCGLSDHDTFRSCVNAASVGANDNKVGGFAGMSTYSEFSLCENSGFVGHHTYEVFKNYANTIRAKIEAMTETSTFAAVTGIVGMGITVGTAVILSRTVSSIATRIVGHSCEMAQIGEDASWFYKIRFSFEASRLSTDILHGIPDFHLLDDYYYEAFIVKNHYVTGASIAGYTQAVLAPLAIVLAVELGVTIAATILEGDDEAGGICGQALGGNFELCTNHGSLNCKDDNCGGIVGLGQGVTINNCFNDGKATWDEDDTTASILGKAEANEEDEEVGYKQCLVTNCLSTWPFHIVGDYEITDGLDPASGNNYRISGGEGDAVNCEMQVNQQQVQSGIVAMWLNQGFQNRIKGATPWRQNIVAEADSLKDNCPVLNIAHDIVTIDVIPHDTIRTAGQLMAFAQKVNNGNQFACAVLDADINMAGQDWIPIGKDESGRHYRGLFDGRCHIISGLKCESSKAVGLFGAVHSGAEIRNVIIGADCEFVNKGDDGAGGIVGEVAIGWHWGNVVIDRCGVEACTIVGKNNAGGILGLVENYTKDAVKVFVNDCYSMANVRPLEGNSALLCGYMRNSGVVYNCWSEGTLQSSNWEIGFDNTQEFKEYFVGFWEILEIDQCRAIRATENVQGSNGFLFQNGVQVGDSWGTPGLLTHTLNHSVSDGTQAWYQKLGVDPHPVLRKLPDGSNIVFCYQDSEGWTCYGNTTYDEITEVILGADNFSDHRVTDIDWSGKADVQDLVKFIDAANK